MNNPLIEKLMYFLADITLTGLVVLVVYVLDEMVLFILGYYMPRPLLAALACMVLMRLVFFLLKRKPKW
jgi:hypothetical protein